MKKIIYPDRSSWEPLLKRPELDYSLLKEQVSQIITRVRAHGDAALVEYNKKFDDASPTSIKLDLREKEFKLDPKLLAAIKVAKANIENFHSAQGEVQIKMETTPGVSCWRKSVPIETVGLYIPGGSAPLFFNLAHVGDPGKTCGL